MFIYLLLGKIRDSPKIILLYILDFSPNLEKGIVVIVRTKSSLETTFNWKSDGTKTDPRQINTGHDKSQTQQT